MGSPGRACTRGCADTGLAAWPRSLTGRTGQSTARTRYAPRSRRRCVSCAARIRGGAPARLAFELGNRDIDPVPSEATVDEAARLDAVTRLNELLSGAR